MSTGITFLIPICGAPPSSSDHLSKLVCQIGEYDKVIIINDLNSNLDHIENLFKTLPLETGRCEYFRNQSELGFVGTCNRALHELDKSGNDIFVISSDFEIEESLPAELNACINSSERHGIAFPNSNLNWVAKNEITSPSRRSAEEAFNGHFHIRSHLPRFEPVPIGLIPCFLVRRKLIENFGFLDENISKESEALDELSLRLSNYGFSTLICNHSFAFSHRSTSPPTESSNFSQKTTDRQKEKLDRNQKRNQYEQYQIQGVSRFQNLLASQNSKKSVLISLCDFPLMYNGTTEYGLLFLENLSQNFRSRFNIYIVVNREANTFHNLQRFGFPIIFPEALEDSVFDICFVPRQIFSLKHLFLINRASPRIVASFLDIIAIRCHYLSDHNLRILWTTCLQFFQRIICISENVKSDILSFFDFLHLDSNKFSVVYLGIEDSEKSDLSGVTTFQNLQYHLIIGNGFKHKAIVECVASLGRSDLSCHFVVLGADPESYSFLDQDRRFHFVKSGLLDSQTIDRYYADAISFIFPSQYEGFGLPILKAVRFNKRLILASSAVNKEITSQIANSELYFTFFDSFAQIPTILKSFDLVNKKDESDVSNSQKKMFYERTWKLTTKEIESLIEREMIKDIDFSLLNQRFETINNLYYLASNSKKNAPPGILIRAMKKLLRIAKFFLGKI